MTHSMSALACRYRPVNVVLNGSKTPAGIDGIGLAFKYNDCRLVSPVNAPTLTSVMRLPRRRRMRMFGKLLNVPD